jgi:hypothetical protein
MSSRPAISTCTELIIVMSPLDGSGTTIRSFGVAVRELV